MVLASSWGLNSSKRRMAAAPISCVHYIGFTHTRHGKSNNVSWMRAVGLEANQAHVRIVFAKCRGGIMRASSATEA